LTSRVAKFFKNIRNRFHLFFVGKVFEKRCKDLEAQVEFMSSIITQQSQLIASLAVVQSDLAKSIRENGLLDSSGEYLTLRIPISDDGPAN